jgi:hypothetical protein
MKSEQEKWIEAYEFSNYEVSNFGRIRNSKTEKVLKQRQDGKEYKMVSIYNHKKKYTVRVARLIWQSFNNCKCKDTIDHIDRDRGNDFLKNLRCIPYKEQYLNKSKYYIKNKYNLTKSDKKLIQEKYDAGLWSTWDIMKFYDIPINYVQTTMKRGSWKKYLSDES